MFEILTEKLGNVIRSLNNRGKLGEKDIDEALRHIRIALLEADVNFKVVKTFLAGVREKALTATVLESLTPGQQIVKIVNEELIQLLGKTAASLSTAQQLPSIILLAGLQGAGKTTTASKLALNFKQTGQRPLLVAADTRRPAAIEQLMTLGKQLDVPVYSEDLKSTPLTICRNAVKKAKEMGASWMIVDTQGRLHVDEMLMKELSELKKELHPSEVLLVVDAMTGQDAVKIAEEFNNDIGLTGLILTKMDGDARGGAALSIRSVTGVPIKFIGTGEKASTIETFYPDRLASRILGMGDMLTLIEKAEKTFDQQKLAKLEKNIRSQTFTLEDFLEQLNQIKKMGPLSQVMDMIPGLNKLSSTMMDGKEDQQMKRIEAIILSMTPEERRNPAIIGGSRRRRIARGSGTMPRDVNQVLNQFYQLQKLTKVMAKGKMPKNLMNMMR
jgi:signal recognition particle subunit SRP54